MKHKLVIVAISSALALSAKAVPAEEPQFVSECPGWNCTSEGQICVTGDGKNEERFQYVCKDSRWEELQTGTKELTQALENVEWRKLHDALRKSTPSTPSTPSPTEPTPAYVNKCPGWSCEQNGQICVEDVPVVLWGTDAGFFHGMFPQYDESDGSFYLCNNNTWSGISRTEANNHLTRRFRDKGAIGD